MRISGICKKYGYYKKGACTCGVSSFFAVRENMNGIHIKLLFLILRNKMVLGEALMEE